MARKPIDPKGLDRQAYKEADAHFRHVSRSLPTEHVEVVAREVVRRLAFRMPRSVRADHLPTEGEIDRFCAALLSQDEQAGDRFILAARRGGVPAEVIYLSYVAGAARQLGKMWDDDRATFMEVTLGCGRLYRIIRGLRHVIDSGWTNPDEKPTLFALAPEETHTLGIEIATDIFRREGWDVELSVGEDHDTVVARAEKNRFLAIVLVANSEHLLPQLIQLILALRITQPMAPIVVAGNIVELVPDIEVTVGADAVISDIETAIDTLRMILADHQDPPTE